MNTKQFSDWLQQVNDIEIIKVNETSVMFFCNTDNVVSKVTAIAEKTGNPLTLHTNQNKICMCLHNHDLASFYKAWNRENKKGLPDLSWVTCKQMADELKKRENLTFALVWMEELGHDNISFEANGNPTILCGLLTRSLNIAIRWADKNLDFHEPKED
jgi:hypothetical protein